MSSGAGQLFAPLDDNIVVAPGIDLDVRASEIL
jgi:hypothetical protein